MAVDSVALKLPTFWVSSPAARFSQAKAQFALKNITQDDTKYYHVVSSQDTNTATRSLSVISSPPTTYKYKTLKSFLTSAYGLTDEERASELLNMCGLGDAKPSEFMDSRLTLLGQHHPCFIFKQIFLQQLPEHVRTPLAVSDTTDYCALAQQADKLYLASQPRQQTVAEAVTSCQAQAPTSSSDKISAICWYHQKWGEKGKKCLPTCPKFRNFKTHEKNQGNARAGQQ
ncbi:retrovirus-related Pol polyprotein [Elysia marginata]|uniref:Retrovirus-related Pol polyprotein n=1 Tax=Elysia marginata TaxID=1093978 RepID=A0AAV4G9M1_9GAST|nr:retrovirus-related Pol polyprotein [Elysia marginata]